VCLVESFPKKNYVTRMNDRRKRFLEVLINYSQAMHINNKVLKNCIVKMTHHPATSRIANEKT